MTTMLAITVTVKAIDTQRWTCRIHLFQFMSPPHRALGMQPGRSLQSRAGANGATTLLREPPNIPTVNRNGPPGSTPRRASLASDEANRHLRMPVEALDRGFDLASKPLCAHAAEKRVFGVVQN